MFSVSYLPRIKRYGECPSCGFRQELKGTIIQEYNMDEDEIDKIVNIGNYECSKCHHKWIKRWINQLR